MKSPSVWFAVFVLLLSLCTAAWGQWSADASQNLALAAKGNGNDQVQPKVKPLPNGGWYVSWFDADPSAPPVGYSVYLQRLRADGVEQYRHDGLRVVPHQPRQLRRLLGP